VGGTGDGVSILQRAAALIVAVPLAPKDLSRFVESSDRGGNLLGIRINASGVLAGDVTGTWTLKDFSRA